jgi:hypothetical protein
MGIRPTFSSKIANAASQRGTWRHLRSLLLKLFYVIFAGSCLAAISNSYGVPNWLEHLWLFILACLIPVALYLCVRGYAKGFYLRRYWRLDSKTISSFRPSRSRAWLVEFAAKVATAMSTTLAAFRAATYAVLVKAGVISHTLSPRLTPVPTFSSR